MQTTIDEKNRYKKEYFNAIVTGDTTFRVKRDGSKKKFLSFVFTYSILVFLVIVTSLVLLGVGREWREENKAFLANAELVIFGILAFDMLLRWYTADVRLKKGIWSFMLFPFTITGILLIAALLPSIATVTARFEEDQIWKDLQNFKFLRIFRIILLANLVPGVAIFKVVLLKERKILYTVAVLVLIAIALFALVIYNIEAHDPNRPNETNPEIHDFFDALYFSTICLTTIGFGDVSPISDIGRIVTMVMAIIGIAVLAIPSGVLAGGFISEMKSQMKMREELDELDKELTKKEIGPKVIPPSM